MRPLVINTWKKLLDNCLMRKVKFFLFECIQVCQECLYQGWLCFLPDMYWSLAGFFLPGLILFLLGMFMLGLFLPGPGSCRRIVFHLGIQVLFLPKFVLTGFDLPGFVLPGLFLPGLVLPGLVFTRIGFTRILPCSFLDVRWWLLWLAAWVARGCLSCRPSWRTPFAPRSRTRTRSCCRTKRIGHPRKT